MRRCEVDKIGIDLPCGYKAPYFIKIASKRIGDKRKVKIFLCHKHRDILQDKEYLTHLLDERDGSTLQESQKWRAHMR